MTNSPKNTRCICLENGFIIRKNDILQVAENDLAKCTEYAGFYKNPSEKGQLGVVQVAVIFLSI